MKGSNETQPALGSRKPRPDSFTHVPAGTRDKETGTTTDAGTELINQHFPRQSGDRLTPGGSLHSADHEPSSA